MKNCRILLKMALLLCAIVGINAESAFAQFNPQIGDFYYGQFDETKRTCVLTSKIGGLYTNEYVDMVHVRIPESVIHNGKTYQIIGIDLYEPVNGKVIFPKADTVEFLGYSKIKELGSVFQRCTKLRKVTGLSSLEYMQGTFRGCTSLTAFKNARLTKVDHETFMGCTALTSVVLPELKEVGMQAFEGCEKLTTHPFTNPSKLEKIGERSFKGCVAMKDVFVPKTLTEIGAGAFSGLTQPVLLSSENEKFIVENEILYDKYPRVLKFCPNKFYSSINLPTSLREIEAYAFAGSTHLYDLDLSKLDNLEKIGEYAFSGSGLLEFIIPDKIKEIPNGMLRECKKLKHLLIPASVTKIEYDAFVDTESLEEVYAMMPDLTKVDIQHLLDSWDPFQGVNPECKLFVPKGTKEAYSESPFTKDGINSKNIFELYKFKEGDLWYQELSDNTVALTYENYWFPYWTSKLPDTLDIPAQVTHQGVEYTVTELGENVLVHIYNLKEVSIPSSVKTIGAGAFAVSGLTKIEIPEGVDSIAGGAFGSMSELKSVSIPASVRVIDSLVFFWSDNLETLVVSENNPNYKSVNNSLFTKDGSRLMCRAPKASTPDSVYYIPSSVTSIDQSAFFLNKGFKEISIPASIKKIEKDAFYGVNGLDIWYCNSTDPASIELGEPGVSSLFGGCSKDTLYVPTGMVDTYKALDGWKEFGTILDTTIAATGIELEKTTIRMNLETPDYLWARILPGNATETRFKWKVADRDVLEIDKNGKITGLKDGTTTIIAISKDGNFESAPCTVTVGKSTSVKDLNASAVKLFPNPAQGTFFVEVPQAGNLEIMNLTGQRVFAQQLQAGKTAVNLSQSGMYIVYITGKDYRTVQKVIIK